MRKQLAGGKAREPRSACDAYRAHDLAVTDGTRTALLGRSGASEHPQGAESERLLEQARAWLRGVGGPGPAPAREIDPATREALEALGYAR